MSKSDEADFLKKESSVRTSIGLAKVGYYVVGGGCTIGCLHGPLESHGRKRGRQ